MPLVQNGRLVAVLGLSEPQAHVWRNAEVRLVEEVAERTWAAVDQARVFEVRAQRSGHNPTETAAVPGGP